MGKMAKKKKKACGCKHWRRYEITSYCNTVLADGNAKTGIWGGGWGVFLGKCKDLEGRMERLAGEKKDIEGSGEQEDRQTGENASFPSARTNSTHVREISKLEC